MQTISKWRLWQLWLAVTVSVTTNVNGTYQGLYTKEAVDAELVVPAKVTSTGERLSSKMTQREGGLLFVNISTAARHYHLVLRSTEDFLAPQLMVERHRRGGRTRRSLAAAQRQCHYQGHIHGEEQNSAVAISACNGLTGLIRDGDGVEYLVEPVHSDSQISEKGHKHIMFRRSAVKPKPPYKKQRKKKKKHKSKNCGTREPPRPAETRLEWQQYAGLVKVQGRKKPHEAAAATRKRKLRLKVHRRHGKHKRKPRSVSLPRYVETLVVADPSMLEFHSDGDVETYLLTVMNMVSALYADPSIGNLVKIVVVRIILLEDADSGLDVMINADTTLRNFCKWQRNQNHGNDTHPNHHDVAILVTRKDICARQSTPCSTLGVAHVGGMCQADRSCSVNEDNGISLAHTITHELGHNFGMYHDTEKIGCNRRSGTVQHVMTPSFESDTTVIAWSSCSRRDITNFFDQGGGHCLNDEPGPVDYSYPDLPPGAMYNAEHQCRLQFGKGAQMCSPLDEICSRLWCEIDGVCTTVLKPAAPGTHCGKHMWCQNKECVQISERKPAIDGGWSGWSDWSSCSRTCGAGVSIQERRCDNPKPSAGGNYCVGERKRYKMCNTDPCPEGEPGFRAVQCSSYNNQTFHDKKYKWLPYFERSEPCELYCTDADETVIVPWGQSALDGTPCNVGTRDICISGLCRKVGCDWLVDSNAKEDRCGVCKGEGKQCNSIKGIYVKQAFGTGYKEMVVIPTGSRNIKIEELDFSKNYIGIGSARSSIFYLNGNWEITLSGAYKVAGAEALYEREDEWEKILIPGPIQEDILIYMISRGRNRNPGIQYEYTLTKFVNTTASNFEWKLNDWSPCSVTCGGGTQHHIPVCINNITMEEAEAPIPCLGEDRPPEAMRVCNTETCPTHWWIGPWQSCPATCSRKGQILHRLRSVMCVDDREIALSDRHCDHRRKPKEREMCRSIPICSEER